MDELKNNDAKRRAQTIKNLNSISISLGPEKSRAILVPFLVELFDEEDEVLIALI
jgi:serine/threonine-protein phosphatase 2A regulatory subunit A